MPDRDNPPSQHPLRVWRLSQHLTLEEAAALIGMSRRSWLAWEEGLYPRSGTIAKIYRATRGAVTPNNFVWPRGMPVLPANDDSLT